ncbi:hypothetical protein Desde_1058 [Desulfitobacterium dehalogenans ATCC 51507]|uniref:Uncharacterized protein n=1 Tax=Desulfitobacterium dehalogenans (strain ATCC 51507 / DSM 9161 / JW/IU-DC1) TaxID=756499 RepID=I4A6A6_DESDJ|nr:hypothetical protein [Desulfitobacterium dehalogenans]AFL99490.1 hypothetical protein Desde_1058 [Desulfitobacterium dehalogenans ATCC 51507]
MSIDNVEHRISSLKTKLEQKKNERTRAEANLETAEKQLQAVTDKIKALGYEPEQLPAVIEELEKNIEVNLAQAEKILAEMEGLTTEQVLEQVV